MEAEVLEVQAIERSLWVLGEWVRKSFSAGLEISEG